MELYPCVPMRALISAQPVESQSFTWVSVGHVFASKLAELPIRVRTNATTCADDAYAMFYDALLSHIHAEPLDTLAATHPFGLFTISLLNVVFVAHRIGRAGLPVATSAPIHHEHEPEPPTAAVNPRIAQRFALFGTQAAAVYVLAALGIVIAIKTPIQFSQ